MITTCKSDLQYISSFSDQRHVTDFESNDGHELLESQDLIEQATAAKERLENEEVEHA